MSLGSSWVTSKHLLDGQSLGITDVGEVGNQLEAIDNLAAGRTAALDTEAQDTSEAPLEILLSSLVVSVALQAWVRNPRDVRALLQVSGQGQSVLGVALGTETEGLDTEDELLGGKGVERGTNVSQELNSGADNEGDGAKGLPELEAVVALGGLDELRESLAVLAPVKLAGVDDDTSNGGSVAADPLGGRVNDDVGAVVDGADKVSTGTKSVVNLVYCLSVLNTTQRRHSLIAAVL